MFGYGCIVQAYRGGGRAGRADKKAQKFELTEEQKQEIREAFDLFDTDGSGTAARWCADTHATLHLAPWPVRGALGAGAAAHIQHAPNRDVMQAPSMPRS